MGVLRYHIALVVSNVLFGVSFSVYVSLLQGAMLSSQLFALQLLFSTIVVAMPALFSGRFFRLTLNEFGSIFIVALLVVFGWWYLLMEGASYTNPIDASTITTIGPIFTLITSIIAHSRRAKWGEIAGIVIAVLGVATILVDRGRLLVGDAREGYGNTIVLCAVVAIAVNTVLITPVLRRHGAMVVMGWYYLIGTVLAMPLIVKSLPTLHLSDLSHLQLGEIAYILLFGSALPMYLLYASSEHLTAVHNAIYRYIQPIVAAVVATLRGQAIIDRTNIVGAVLIFIGMLCVIFATPRSEVAIRE
jgi:drug/metabolite transporter (DMT)-like permease